MDSYLYPERCADDVGLRAYRQNVGASEQLACLGMVSATLAHELTQPLTVVQLAMQNTIAELEKRDCPDVVRRDLQDGLAACSALRGIVSRFRSLAGRFDKPRETEVHIDQVAERTLRLFEQVAEAAQMRMWTEDLETLPPIRMQEHELDQLFFVLCQNAVQAADGVQGRHLIVTGTLQGDTIVLGFQDNCGGIEPAHLPRIFEPFFTTKPPGQGTGLGLCIAHRIVALKGGQIAVRSKRGEGTTFVVSLPRD